MIVAFDAGFLGKPKMILRVELVYVLIESDSLVPLAISG